MRRPLGSLPMPYGRQGDATIVRRLLAATVKRSSLTRKQIAAAMVERLAPHRYKCSISERALNGWTATSRSHDFKFPLQYAITFCEVTGDHRLLRELVKRAGFRMIGHEEEKLIELGKAVVAKAAAERAIDKAVAK